jgi:hypothetical protein
MLPGGGVISVTVKPADVAAHPFASLVVTVYVPGAVMIVDCVVAPVDHS